MNVIGGKFIPVVDEQFNIIAYEAGIELMELEKEKADFSLDGIDLSKLFAHPDYFIQKLALENYRGSVPLILKADCVDPLPDSFPRPEGVQIVLLLKEWMDKKYLDRVFELYAGEEISYALSESSNGVISWPFSISTHPEFIKITPDRRFPRNDMLLEFAKDTWGLNNFLEYFFKPLKDMGIRIIACDILSEEDFELMKPVADAFMGVWVSEQLASRNIEVPNGAE
ncbi:hypothetical protein [Paenibacillus sp. GYB003]|uniref:hypothetical protein n=1 Tax=Paenibacillus sp. GYB003 TaxID=2994392 RepID=UPI002F969FC3